MKVLENRKRENNMLNKILNKKGIKKEGQYQLIELTNNSGSKSYTIRLVDYDTDTTIKTVFDLEEAQKEFEVL